MTDATTAEKDEEPDETSGGDGLVETIRQVVGEALGELFDSGRADVAEGASAAADAAEKPLTAAEVQRLARDEMAKAQAALKAKKTAKTPAKAPAPDAAQAPANSAPPAPSVRSLWEKVQHGIWGEKD